MRKCVVRGLVSVAAAGAAFLLAGAGSASAAPTLPTDLDSPTFEEVYDDWSEGGGNVGYGAAQMVAAAWYGVPLTAIELFQEAFGE